MIGFLRGVVAFRDDPFLLIDVSGVGYRVIASRTVLSKLNGIGEKVAVFTYTHVREEALELYGFATQDDLKLFEMLLSVSGIGPKTALGIFTIGEARDIQEAIRGGNVDFFTTVPRLGRKNAQKIIIELKGKLGSIAELDLTEKDVLENKDVLSALRAFGFSSREAGDAIRAIRGQGQTTEERVRLALRYLGK